LDVKKYEMEKKKSIYIFGYLLEPCVKSSDLKKKTPQILTRFFFSKKD
jgi:hypothetical protein